ncbi:MAG: uncharacterized protein A8A55_2625 [Amphiamblys sp. WSBS2006]|nr:MAG: uncharacterized protein A8A55_2625 [Amphiamblys sp. WSBS2006]
MRTPQDIVFARHQDTFFVLKENGMLLLSDAPGVSEKARETLYRTKERVLAKIKRSDYEAECMVCRIPRENKHTLFPLCGEAHFFVCRECIEREVGSQRKGNTRRLFCPYCPGDAFAVAVHGEVLPLVQKRKLFLAPDIKNTNAVLTENTKVFIGNIAISEDLLFRLLERTAVYIRGTVCVFYSSEQGDCIAKETGECIEVSLTQNTFDRGRTGKVLENIRRAQKNNIACFCQSFCFSDSALANLLPKLLMPEDNEMEVLVVSASKREHISEFLGVESESIWIGAVERIRLGGYAVCILPKIKIGKENETDTIVLSAGSEKHVKEVLSVDDKSIWLGRVNSLKLRHYALGVLPKLRVHRHNYITEVVLSATSKEQTAGARETEDRSIWLGRIERLVLKRYALDILPKLRIDRRNRMEALVLSARCEEYIGEALKTKDRSICIGEVARLKLKHFAAGLASKLKITGKFLLASTFTSIDSRRACSRNYMHSD